MEDTVGSDPRIGTLLQERYRILERIAAGGMGVVYRGERIELGRAVAIKFLHGWVAADPSALKRFRIEAQAMSQLSHPCCVSIIDFGVEGTAPFLVMDFVTGQTLGSLVHDTGPLPAKRAVNILRQVLAGLAHAHAQGIVHRDIKPENIFLTEAIGLGDQVRILDFGLARLRDSVTGLTLGMPIGTPSYMAPEQVRGEDVDARTDIYSAGVLLFELLTGQKPFHSERAAAVMHQHQETQPPTLGTVLPGAGFSPQLEAAVSKALAKRPEDRFPSATDFAAALEQLPELSAPSSPPPTQPPPDSPTPSPSRKDAPARTGRALRVAGGAVGLVLVGVAGVLLWPSGPDAPPVSGTPTPAPESASPAQPPASAPKRGDSTAPPRIPPEPLPDIEQIERWVRQGQRDSALRALAKLRAQYPASAYAPYLEGQVNFDNLRWVDGLASYGAAIRNNPAYRSDPTLIRDLIECLVSDRFHDKCADFLAREVGAPAAPFLDEAARTHAYANVRTRAARLLPKVTGPQ